MNTIERWWNQWSDVVADDPWMWAAVAGGVIVLLLGLLALRALRSRRSRQTQTTVEEDHRTLVRRPIYVDAVGLADLLAVSESGDLSRSLRDDLEPTGLDGTDLWTRESRDLNKILAAFDAHPHLAADLDRDGEAALATGRAVRVTGRLTRLPASELAELLELATPILAHHGTTTGRAGTATTTAHSIDLSRPVATEAPLVAEMTAAGTSQRLLVVFEPGGWREGAIEELPETATLVGVVDRQLDSGQSVSADDYLTPHLSTDARRAVADRDLHDVVRPLSDLSAVRLRRKDLTFKGPGALVTPVALFH